VNTLQQENDYPEDSKRMEGHYLEKYAETQLSHRNVLLDAMPDCGYEYFWLNFKGSVARAAAVYPPLESLALQVHTVTAVCNELKAAGNYDRIALVIQEFLGSYFWTVLGADSYHLSIATTNFRRWLRCCNLRAEHPVPEVTPLDPLEYPTMNYLYFLHRMADSHANIRNIIRDLVVANAERETMLSELFDAAVNLRKAGLVDKFLVFFPEWTAQRFQERHGLKIPKGIKTSNKILKMLP